MPSINSKTLNLPMRYFNKFIKNTIFTKRDMSSLKLFLWENVMFVNSVFLPGEIEKKYMITTLITIKNNTRRLNMCRKPDDTVVMLLQRFALKIQQAKIKKKIKKPVTDCIFLKVNGTTVPDDTKCSQVFDGKNINISLEINDKTLSVMVNVPIINDLLLGKPPYKCLMLYPYAFDKGYNASILKSKYTWYRVKSNNVVKVGDGIVYIPTNDDLRCKLKLVCEPCNEDGHLGPTVEVLSEEVVDNIVNSYPFEKRLIDKPSNSFRVLSYNILAEDYTKTKEAKHEMYPYCSASILASSYRNPLLLKELIAYKADILCLQEVELKFFNRVLVPLLNHYLNLNGVHCKKDGNKNEGSSCFFSADKFVMLEQFNIKLNDHVAVEMYCGPLINTILNDDLWKQGLQKKTVLQILLLETRCSNKQLLLVCNTHLISDPDGDSIRLLQSLIELTIIKEIKKTVKNHFSDRNLSVIFCGDFNSTPESGVYDLVTNSLLPEEHRHCTELNNLKDKVDFKMFSAYSNKVEYSNFTQTFFGLLDYIYFTDQHLKLVQVLPMPSHEEVIENVGLPSVLFPSDHLALIADFKFKCIHKLFYVK